MAMPFNVTVVGPPLARGSAQPSMRNCSSVSWNLSTHHDGEP